MRSHQTHATQAPQRPADTAHPGPESRVVRGARLEFRARPAGAAYFTDDTGTRWRIYDCVARRGRLERVYLEADAAMYRVFVASDGKQCAYHRGRREGFHLSAESCARQLHQAQLIRSGMRLAL
jgi:hypothetical protein